MKSVRFAGLFLCFVTTALLAPSHPLPMASLEQAAESAPVSMVGLAVVGGAVGWL
jgi:hypothetical protein